MAVIWIGNTMHIRGEGTPNGCPTPDVEIAPTTEATNSESSVDTKDATTGGVVLSHSIASMNTQDFATQVMKDTDSKVKRSPGRPKAQALPQAQDKAEFQNEAEPDWQLGFDQINQSIPEDIDE